MSDYFSMRKHLIVLAGTLSALGVHADEGMWTYDNLPKARMQAALGFAPSDAWVANAMQASVRLAGGCSGSFVSKDGLVLTNHHCAIGCVQQISSEGHDLVQSGFTANRREDEVKCPEIELNRLDAITDVTAEVRSAVQGRVGRDYTLARNAVGARLASACVGADTATVRCDLVPLYQGGVYQLYKYHRYSDVRLVFAPEEGIANFGGDPDNFSFPRFDLDMALLRAYEGGKPAPVKAYFPLSRQGAAEGEATFTSGHPGRTERQLTVAQLEYVRDVELFHRLVQTAEIRGVLAQYAKTNAEAARVSTNALRGVENAYKLFYGEAEALQSPALFATKRKEEEALRAYVAAHPELSDVAGAWDAIARALTTARDIEYQATYIGNGRGFASAYFRYARLLVRWADEQSKPSAERLPEFADAQLHGLREAVLSTAPVYPAFETNQLAYSLTKMRERLGVDSPFVKRVLQRESPEQLAARLVTGTRLGDVAVRRALWEGGPAAVARSDDPFIVLARQVDGEARAVRAREEDDVQSVLRRNQELIAKARFARTGTADYPDATFTLRLSYGRVRGWTEHGQPVLPFTSFQGAYDRATGAEPFALPDRWLAAKDRLNLSQRFNFVTDNDIIGGNSGSPMINRQGELIGLVFDGNLESLGGSYSFDPAVNRAVAVHSGAILEALDKVYGAGHLVRELTTR